MTVKRLFVLSMFLVALSAVAVTASTADRFQYTTAIPDGILTPDTVETSIGTLTFTDGVPSRETAEKAYDFMDTARAADAFLKGMPAASVAALIEGAHSLGAVEVHQVLLFDGLMNARSLFLTGNSSTIYVSADLDLKRDGPTVVEAPAGLLGAANDGFFRYMVNFLPGKYLFLPPGYEGEVPEGYTVVRSETYRVWCLLRKTPKNKRPEEVAAAAKEIKDSLKFYRLADAANPPAVEWVSGTDKAFNTIHYNNAEFYDHMNKVIQYEALSLMTPEIRGLFASLGIEKGKPFNPDDRMKAILADGVAIGNAQARAIVSVPEDRHEPRRSPGLPRHRQRLEHGLPGTQRVLQRRRRGHDEHRCPGELPLPLHGRDTSDGEAAPGQGFGLRHRVPRR